MESATFPESSESRTNQNGSGTDGEVTEDSEVRVQIRFDGVKRRTFALLALSNLCFGICSSLYGPYFPLQAEEKGLSPRYYGFIFGCYHLTALIFTPVIGNWVQNVATKFILFTGAFTVGTCAILFGLLEWCPEGMPFISLAFSIHILDGFGAASIRASVFAIAASQFTEERWTTFIKLEICFSCGMVIGPIAGGALYDFGGFSLPFFCAGVLILLDSVLVMAIVPEPDEIKVKVTTELWTAFKLTGNFLYFFGIFTSAYYTGFLEATLVPHLKQFHLQGLFIGLLFQTPEAVYSLLAYGWKWGLRKGLNSVMLIFIANLLLIASIILVAPASFTKLRDAIGYIIVGLILKGVGQSAKDIASFYGAYSDSVCHGFPNDVSTHSLIFEMYAFGSISGNFIGSFSAGYIYEKLGFDSGVVIPFGLEVIAIPFVLSYAFRRNYKKPVLHRTEETRPILSNNVNGS